MATEGISNSYRMVLMSVVVVMSSGTALAIKLSADENGKHHYSSAAVVLLAELFKLCPKSRSEFPNRRRP